MSEKQLKLENIYDALQRTDADIRVTHGDNFLKFDGKEYTVTRIMPRGEPVELIRTETEGVAVMMLTGHATAV